ncbi:MAG: HD domain-containing protein, partial [Deltaproteobacteria bacterium]|nr:HD domain-containing protein [Deltaproteobacteria bacterium]
QDGITKGYFYTMNTKSAELSHLWIKDITKEASISGSYLVKQKRVGTTRNGNPFISITISDRTGDLEAKIWDGVEGLSDLFSEGDIVEIEGFAGIYRDQIQATVSGLKLQDGKFDPEIFMESSPFDTSEMMASLREILKEIKNVHLIALIDRLLNDRRFLELFKKAPAAKNLHHSYLGGLLEHTLSVCRLSAITAIHYPQLDRDLLIAGAFLHDIGKTRELKYDLSIDYTDEGRLLGHIVIGSAMLDRKIGECRNFPEELAVRLKHMMLSHHGQYEFGSPKRPKFLEAFALSMLDDLDAKIAGISRIMDADRQKGPWTEFNRLFDRYLLKGNVSPFGEETVGGDEIKDRQGMLF